jgi:glutathione S-transferase
MRRAVLRTDAFATRLVEKLYERGYEFARRIPAKRDPAIVARVECQIDSALSWLEELAPAPWLLGDQMSRADVTTAIAFTYMVEKHRSLLDRRPSPVLDAHCRHCEALSQFVRVAYSPAKAELGGWYPEA